MDRQPATSRLIALAGAWSLAILAVFCPMIFLSGRVPHDAKVTTAMMLGALALWVGAGGALMWRYRPEIVAWLRSLPIPERPKFVLAATALAGIEEAITTLMTNLAPLLGGTWGVHGIVNSTNWFHVVLLHSVVTFVPAFVVWAWLLHRYAFTPAQAFLLYGITGTLAEGIFMRPDALAAGYWIFVYGLFVWLPAHAMRRPAAAIPPRLRHCAMAIVLPLVAAAPVAMAAMALDRALGLRHLAPPL